MAELTVSAPAKIKITNNSGVVKKFAPYKENFTVDVANGSTVEFEVKTSGQVLYYLKQKTTGLDVEVMSGEFDSASDTITVLNVPAKVTIANKSEKEIGFIPYKENFPYYIAKNDSVILTADNVGQVLYYLAQATEGLEVKQEKSGN